MTMSLWEATTNSLLARLTFTSKLTALDVTKDGQAAFVGSEGGVLRVYDVSKLFNGFKA